MPLQACYVRTFWSVLFGRSWCTAVWCTVAWCAAAWRFFFPHRRKYLLSNLKFEEKKAACGSAPSGSAPRPPEADGPKCAPVTGLQRQKMYVDLYIKIVICSSILLSTLFYIAKKRTQSLYIYIYIYIKA